MIRFPRTLKIYQYFRAKNILFEWGLGRLLGEFGRRRKILFPSAIVAASDPLAQEVEPLLFRLKRLQRIEVEVVRASVVLVRPGIMLIRAGILLVRAGFIIIEVPVTVKTSLVQSIRNEGFQEDFSHLEAARGLDCGGMTPSGPSIGGALTAASEGVVVPVAVLFVHD